jgi:DNA-nicking Smr family endonuclease
MTFLSEEDKNLFRQAVKGAQRLKNSRAHSPQPSKPPKRQLPANKLRNRQTRQALNRHPAHAAFSEVDLFENLYSSNGADGTSNVGAFESLSYQKSGLQPRDWKRLKKGEFSTFWVLDLHGETLESADKILLQFMQEAHRQNARYVRVIHGKGYHSESEAPTLKNLVNQRLGCILLFFLLL